MLYELTIDIHIHHRALAVNPLGDMKVFRIRKIHSIPEAIIQILILMSVSKYSNYSAAYSVSAFANNKIFQILNC